MKKIISFTLKFHQLFPYFSKKLLAIFFLLLLQFINFESNGRSLYNEIVIVSDDNYPPYIFRDEKGNLQGIIVDQWNLWQEKTGIRVKLIAMDWINAQHYFDKGKADVLETVFYTKQRAEKWIFTEPFAKIEVPVFISKSLSGIKDTKSLQGFTIGVKNGDACIEILRKSGITSFIEYPSYDSIIIAASKGKIKVFCIDKPPALYYLYKYNFDEEFKLSFTLYSGEFHRAVQKKNIALVDIIENGFDKISKSEIEIIEQKWMGKTIMSGKTKRYLIISASVLVIISLILLFFNIFLRIRVKKKTLELKNALEEITYNEEKFRTIFNSVNDTILIHNLFSGKIIEHNSAAEKMFGFYNNEFKNLKIQDISLGIHPFNQNNAMDFISKALKEGPQVFEWQSKNKKGDIFWTEISMSYNATIFKDAIIVVLRDINERKKAEAEIKEFYKVLENKVEERTNQLSVANKELEAFAYTVSHDLRTPLRAIDGYTRILLEDHLDHLSEEGIKVCNVIVRNTKKMGQLIDDLLSFSKISRFEMSKISVDMQLIIDSVCKEIISEEINDKIKIEIETLPQVTGDKSLLKQVWTNLISNAIKFTSKKENPQIHISCEETNNEFIFLIEDNGAGFEMKYADKLFGVFHRLHTSQEYEGTGVGLAIVQRIIQRHGGKIWAEAEIEKGAKFYFTLKKQIPESL
jgi:PAS domain S-box-containing protein